MSADGNGGTNHGDDREPPLEERRRTFLRRRYFASSRDYLGLGDGHEPPTLNERSPIERLWYEEEESEYEEVIIVATAEPQQNQSIRRRIISIVVVLFLFLAGFVWAVFQNLFANWVHQDCALGISDFGSWTHLKLKVYDCVLTKSTGTPDSSRNTRE